MNLHRKLGFNGSRRERVMTVKDVLTKLIIFYVGDRRGGRIVMVRKGKVKG